MARIIALLGGSAWNFYWYILVHTTSTAYIPARPIFRTPETIILPTMGDEGLDVLKGDIWWRRTG